MDDGAGDAAPVVAWQPGDKAVLHFRTTNTATGHVLDDTRKMHLGPFELRVGKSFLVEEWEQVVKTMKVGEKRKFTAADETVRQYPQLARVLRKESERKHAEEHGHEFHDTPRTPTCCFHHMAHDKENADLLDLAPGCLDCEVVVLLEKANTFEKELWEMTLEEKLTKLPQLKEQGKAAFVAKQYEAAAEKYTRALALIENLANKQHLDPTHMDEDKNPDDNAIRNLAARISKALGAAAKKDNQLYKNMFKAAMK
ncbi:hypothetical protein PTSG_05551 [Salpingoeca rosetta]|uniref:peptidylprolyl isomerase n=1 Tax=Salpingoeca rosetta (strain ATCC 50818 / BSB-021) TaxID=946362 RepID=F2UBJ0_SALR5|nr:uncharacterized protein PTSG_05551 [Salpingoeca rosetta]EGD73856.1 hypothetical protein PTSG_05551 [Salpingoeca rosetta]|eukprot:XP_004993419.1 hypothetical protein PTSG_05551 [Salpingoeca rosetta]